MPKTHPCDKCHEPLKRLYTRSTDGWNAIQYWYCESCDAFFPICPICHDGTVVDGIKIILETDDENNDKVK